MYGSESQLKHLMLSIHVWKLQSWRHWCKETSVICIFGGQCFTIIIIVEYVLLKAPEEMFSGLQYWLMCSVAGTEASNYSSYRAILLKLSTGQNWRKYTFYSGISEVLFPPPVRIWLWSRQFCWYFCCSPVALHCCLTEVACSAHTMYFGGGSC